ncbi:hypothetical protein N657DRAFT_644770 [Parathielavia appendiculata]|uniref:Uncharacterized protein n=1 Tax=Parathielavia appendiculata TaxID=2587402 RepID=A0AAN6U165_9PEZI|nr:hypothetical protein N657DRAFT_644770 [Parathielavia appendiculata]
MATFEKLQYSSGLQRSHPLRLQLLLPMALPLQLRQQLAKYSQQTKPSRTRRQLFQKVNKAFDRMDSNIAMLQAENEAPNSVFASIGAIRRAQIEAGAV